MKQVCLAMVLLCWGFVLTAGAVEENQQNVYPSSVLILGPMPGTPETVAAPFPRGKEVLAPEIHPGHVLPDTKQSISLIPGRELHWREVSCDPQGRISLPREGAFWIAVRWYQDRQAEVQFKTVAGAALYCDGEKLEASPDSAQDCLTTTRQLSAGWSTLYARIQGSPFLEASLDNHVSARWSLLSLTPLTRFDDLAFLKRFGSLAIADGGKILARKVSRREPELDRLDILDAKGHLLAADLGGPGTRALGFLPHSRELLLQRSGDEGADLLLWTGPTGPLRTILRGEPDLSFVKISPDGRHLLVSSSAGFEQDDPVKGNRRYVHLRERVTDFTPVPHLHLVDTATGARRQLTTPADRVLDDAVFSTDGQAVYYGQTLPSPERPWFHSEIHRLDLVSGADTLLAEFSGGWEVRPQGFAPSPDGQALLFLGPPEQVGAGHPEHNVYNKQLWRLDLATGRYERLTRNLEQAFDVGGGLPRFDQKGRLLVLATDGSYQRLARFDPRRHWAMELVPLAGQSLGALAASPSGMDFLFTASAADEPEALYRAESCGKSRRLEQSNEQGAGHRLWCRPQAADFVGPGGETIDAWFYPPLQSGPGNKAHFGAPAEGRSPLIVYYYAGAVPTMRGFNGTHQFFAANGYGVLVVNPRGAFGFGDRFADDHAGDWGPKAAADVIAGTESILKQEPWLDREAIGIYGGSYGGFMTDYLVTTTDLYAAAVSMYGISDLATYWGQGAWGWTYGDMALAGATPWDNPDYFVAHSPLFHADKIHTPLLLLHGMVDTNVTPGESEQLFTALSTLGRTVEMVLFPGENHGLSGSWENRVAHRTMLLEWFDRFCKEQPEAWEERWE